MGKLESAIIGWENALLDLGKRNRMINYPVSGGKRRSQQTLRLDEPGYAEIYDLLVRQGKALAVQQPPVEKFDLRCEGMMRLFERLGRPIVPMQGVLRPEGSFTEYRKVLKNMRAKMKLAREEQGIGILYLAVGFLDWKQLTGKLESLVSPLLLVPVRLTMKSIRAPYVIQKLDEDVVVNPALNQLFQMEYGLTLPELPDEDAPVDLFLDQAEELAKKHGWSVRRECHLALMSFQKISMYHDLKRSHERIAQSPVLRAISGEEACPLDASVMDGVELDQIPPEESHLVVGADSSQHYAIELSRRGVSFCLQGPPGGGKSQTITNIIAQALADGRKVLFVAEKMAALDVVHRRLKDAGLGEFTLALHSHRADRKSILAELGQPLQLARQELDHQAMATLDELEELRRSLNIYPALLHRRRTPLDESLYGVLGELSALHALPLIMAQLTGVENLTRSDLNAEATRLSRLARARERYETLPDNPWQGLQGMWTTFMARTQLNNEISSALSDAELLQPLVVTLGQQGLLLPGQELTSLLALQEVCEAAKAGPVSDAWFASAEKAEELAASAAEAAENLARARSEAEAVLLPGARIDAAALHTRMTALDSDLKAVLQNLDWHARLDDYATYYAQLRPLLQHLTDSAEKAMRLLCCTVHTGREADWALNAVKALASAPPLTGDSLPEADMYDPMLARIRDVRQKAAQVTSQIPGLLGRTWTQDALQLDAPGLVQRFTTDYTGFSRMLNISRYNRDMQELARVYCGAGRPDERTALAFLKRLSAWQSERQAWARDAYAITVKLNLPAMGPDGDWETLERQFSALSVLGACADTPGHSRQLLTALQRPDIRQQAGEIQESYLYSAFDRSLRSAAYLGDAMADDISHTLRGVLTASEDLLAMRDAVDSLRPACHPGTTVAAMLEGLRAADEAQRRQRLLEEAADALREVIPTAGEDYAALNARARQIAQTAALASRLPDGLARRLLTGVQPLPQLPCGEKEMQAIARLNAFSARFDEKSSPVAQPFDAMCARLQRCLAEPDALDLWQEWRDVSRDVEGTLFAPFVPAACDAQLPTSQWADAARKLFLYTWVEHVLGEEHLLSLFRAHVHEESIRRFTDLDQQQLYIARSRIRKQLIDGMPDERHRALSATDELAILQREMGKKSGHMPLRRLFSRIPGLLTTLKPCLMMSPLSVASYLESDAITFDLVIFDEASQIMPENAIGAILRGKQVIVTGDTKQMPPTDFFTVSVSAHDYDADEEEEGQEEEILPEESILEQCAAVLPSCPLLWHYRSRHESLIAFSNREIYAGRLVTFPGSIDRQPHLGVELIHVPDGVFHKRRNRQEAKRCIELIEDHILHRSHRSLGVVAFSRTQQSAIEDELHRFRIAHPEYDEFFDEGRDEPFFIKNLENVQGDERDTMIFSVGYARRADGKPMSLNLGPLSAAGGERRLNVAITRARYNVKLVSSVLAKDIDLSRTTSEGTRLLRAYIDYAEKGFAAIQEDGAVQNAAAPQADQFASHLAAVLEEAGYPVEHSVGCSGCRVDVAIRHPEDDSRYALGVMTDGAAYAAQRTCHDRDHLQASVLRGMGWQLHRVWSADWLQRPDGVERELLQAVKAAVEAPAAPPDAQAAQPARVWSRPAEADNRPVPMTFTDYQTALLPEGSDLGINELALRVVETEQPVHRDELCRRLAPALGRDRVDPGLRRDVDVALARLKLDDLREEDGFLFRDGFTLTQPRRAGHRTIDMISPVELQLAIFLVAQHSIGAAREDVIIRVAELLGYERRGPRIQRTLENAFDALVAAGRLRITDGRVEAVPECAPIALNAPEDEPIALPAADAPIALPAPEEGPAALPAADAPIALPAPATPDQEVTPND